MGLSKVLLMSIFVKLNLHEIRYFCGQEHHRTTKNRYCGIKTNFFKFQKLPRDGVGLMQKSITRNSISRNTSDRQVDCGETYYKTFDEELKYFIIVVLEMQQNKPFQTFDAMIIFKEVRLFLRH